METTLKAKSYLAEKIKLAKLTLTKSTELDLLLAEATSNEAWGPDSRTMARIAAASRRFDDFEPIMAFLWKKLEETLSLAARGKLTAWRPAQKALVLLEYLLMHGGERAIKDVELRVYVFEDLAGLQCADKQGFDCAQGIRARAAHICSLARSDGTYQAERARAQELSGRLGNLQGFGSPRRESLPVKKTERFSLQDQSAEAGLFEEGNEAASLIEKSTRDQTAVHLKNRVHWADSASAKSAANATEPFPTEWRFVAEPGEIRESGEFTGGFAGSTRGERDSVGQDDVSTWKESVAGPKPPQYRSGEPSGNKEADEKPRVRARAFDGSALSSHSRVDSWLAQGMALRDPRLDAEDGRQPNGGKFPGPERRTPEAERSHSTAEEAAQTDSPLAKEALIPGEATTKGLERAPSRDLITWDDERPERSGKDTSAGRGYGGAVSGNLSWGSAETANSFPIKAAQKESPKVPAIPPPPRSASSRANLGDADRDLLWTTPSQTVDVDALLGLAGGSF
ncbi:epsin [Klebsormidium nitens]|uniref:Epsin n=1 Tax=Klebsormidium nitens TaxID=105231 RepID=A0A1Y1I6M4_KLENI|nr:epsin [Klebsormidium nitens]|eukprot:GAQ84376.1 epsin [Klebsormidium nitens]